MAKKKVVGFPPDDKIGMVEPGRPSLGVKSQCRLLGISEGSFYYRPVPESAETLEIMDALDKLYTERPFYGSRRLAVGLGSKGYAVGRKRVAGLMKKMGIEAVYPKRDLSKPHPGHKVFPYLLRGVEINSPDQVWSSDITYVRMRGGFLYLAAVLDWYSRFVLSWRLSNTLSGEFCLEVLEEALAAGKKPPAVFNTDQGSQFTAAAFTDRVLSSGAKMSMDGRGRALDNVFIERVWRSLKYEEIYLKEYGEVAEARGSIGRYFDFYNSERPHQSLSYKTPREIYHGPS